MNTVTGRGAAREHEQPATDAPAPDSRPAAGPAPGGRPTAELHLPEQQHRSAVTQELPRTGDGTTATATGPGGGIEPTTGAPVDALPSRVPMRQQGGAPRPDAPADGGPDADAEDFWLPIEEVHWDGTPIRAEPPAGAVPDRQTRARRRRRPRVVRQRDPLPGLAALLGLSLLAAFFAWVSAEPFWLAVGHGTTGTVAVDGCTGSTLTQRCRGTFTADGERFVAHGVRVSGVSAEQRAARTALTARMTGPTGATAYADDGAGRHLRWLLGFGLVGACAGGIARVTGTAGLTDRRARRRVVAVAVTGPLLVTLGFLAAAF